MKIMRLTYLKMFHVHFKFIATNGRLITDFK